MSTSSITSSKTGVEGKARTISPTDANRFATTNSPGAADRDLPETKVGALTVLAVTLLFVGFNYLKGRDVFRTTKKIYAEFTDLGTLEKSNDVKINGLPIGIVYQKKEKDKELSLSESLPQEECNLSMNDQICDSMGHYPCFGRVAKDREIGFSDFSCRGIQLIFYINKFLDFKIEYCF